MSKVGRNDPCPCGSGKKYKLCCINLPATAPPALDLVADVPPIGLDRRSMEQALADIRRLLTMPGLASPQEANALLAELMADPDLEPSAPSTPLEEAQELMLDAWEATGERRAELAREALAISADCTDAYVLLAETVQTAAEARELYLQAIAAAERTVGRDVLEREASYAWGTIDALPYMRARTGLALALWSEGRRREAIEQWTDILRLDRNDNQGIRHILLTALLRNGDDADAEALLKRYRDPCATWAYARALLAFRTHGGTAVAKRARTNAINSNPYVPAYLTDGKPLPATVPDDIGIGDESEAIRCAAELIEAWRQTPDALAWLEQAARTSAPARPPAGAVYQLKVTLKGSRPPIWRRLLVPGDTRLSKLHHILQTALGWWDSHLHEFRVGRRTIGVPDREGWQEVEDERRVRLVDVAPREKSHFTYEYDFGDGWQHEIVVEKILPPEGQARAAVCMAGRRACPPEDIGGVWGYASFLEAIQDPNHPEHEDMMEWIGEPFDPDAFDAERVTAALRRIR